MAISDLSLLIVNYRSASLVRDAIESARTATGAAVEVVLVDNSVEDREFALLRNLGAHQLLRPEKNLGYAGGVNLGMQHCRNDIVVVANPDVVFRPHSVDLLVEQLSGKTALTGPRFTWDEQDRWLLPPAEQPSRAARISEAVATRSRSWQQRRLSRRFRERLRFWSETHPQTLRTVSGAVMCLQKRVFDSVGGFDERFRLYFEEIDLMGRFRREGWRILYEPRAVCQHLFNQSAGQLPEAPSLYLASEGAYYRKWYGGAWVQLIDAIAVRERNAQQFRDVSVTTPIEIPDPVEEHVVEASPLPSFASAAGHFPAEGAVRFPRDVWANFRGEALYLRVADRKTGQARAQYRMAKTD